jgi:hypothetical protein
MQDFWKGIDEDVIGLFREILSHTCLFSCLLIKETLLWTKLHFAYVFRERLSVSKPAKQKLNMERFKSEIGLCLWKTYIQMWILTGLVKLLKKT